MIENGRRIENIAWRLEYKQRQSRSIHASTACEDRAPALSSSVESAASIDSFTTGTTTEGVAIAMKKDTATDTFQNLVLSIKSKQEIKDPLSQLPSTMDRISPPASTIAYISPTPSSTTIQACAPTPRPSSRQSIPVDSSASTLASDLTTSTQLSPTVSHVSSTSAGSEHSVIRGFKPGHKDGISSYTSQSQLAPPSAPQATEPIPTPILKQGGNKRSSAATKKTLFQVGSGDSSDGSAKAMQDHTPAQSQRDSKGSSMKRPAFAKKTSFKEEVVEIESKKENMFRLGDDEDGGAIESDTEDDEEDSAQPEEVSESAIEDDDEWEDDGEPDDEPQPMTFRRTASKPELTSRRSLIADGLHENERSAAMLAAATSPSQQLRRSRTSTPNGPSMPGSPQDDGPLTTQQAHNRVVSYADLRHPGRTVLSPAQTKHNIIAHELAADNLRGHVVHERRTTKSPYAKRKPEADPKRARTYTDMQSLADQAQGLELNPPPGPPDEVNYFEDDTADYHKTGW